MNTLKKLLALSLAITTMMGTIATANFTDSADIKSKEAVQMLTTLGVLNGYTDGSFKPNAVITKSELAKIIYVIKNGGKDDKASNYLGVKTDLTDINGHWAEGYIKYGYTQGIIAGNGHGKFEPEKTVTGMESAKMLLTVLGYDADRAGLVGTSWEKNTLALGSDRNLFEDYNVGFTQSANREYASQMVYNALFAGMMTFRDNGFNEILEAGKPVTMGERYMGLSIQSGNLLATGEYSLGTVAGYSKDKIVIEKNDGTIETFEYKSDASNFIGENVKIISNKKTGKIYGLYSSKDTSKLTAELGHIEMKGEKLMVDGKEVKFSDKALAFTGETGVDFKTAFAKARNSGVKVTFISNNGDSIMDLAVISESKIGKVIGVYKDRISTDISGHNTISTEENSNSIIFDGVKKDDVVIVETNYFNDSVKVSEIDSVSGKVTATRTDEVKIEGNWYKIGEGSTAVLPTLGSEVKISSLGSYIYSVESIKQGQKDVAIVTATSDSQDLDGNYHSRIMLADGTIKTIKTKAETIKGSLVTFNIKDEVYTLTIVSKTNMAGFEGFVSESNGYDSESKKLGSSHISDDATIFVESVKNGEKVYKVMKGSEIKKTNKNFGVNYTALTTEKNGFNYVNIALIVADTDIPNISGTESYGYVVSIPSLISINDITHVSYEIWNGKEKITVSVEGNTIVARKGEYITFETIADGKIDNVQLLDLNANAITAYDSTTGEIMISGDSKTYKITKDTKVLYVDTKDFKGFEDGTIKLADKTGESTYLNNVLMKAQTTETKGKYELDYIIIDINNEIR